MLGRLAIAIGEVGGQHLGAAGLRGEDGHARRGHRRQLHQHRPPGAGAHRDRGHRRHRDRRVRGPHLPHARGRQDRGAAAGPGARHRGPLDGLHARRRPRLHGDREEPRAGAPLHDQAQHGRHRLGRHRRARAGRHRPRGRHAGHGGQGAAVQALRRRRRLPDLPGHQGPRRDRRDRHAPGARPSAASTSRTSRHPGAFDIEERLVDADGHPGVPRRPARHRDRDARRARERAEDRRQGHGRPQGRRRRCRRRRCRRVEDPHERRRRSTSIGCDRQGAVHTGREGLNKSKQWFAENTNPDKLSGSIAEVMPGADVFIGLSGPGPDHPRRRASAWRRTRSCSPWPTPTPRSAPS